MLKKFLDSKNVIIGGICLFIFVLVLLTICKVLVMCIPSDKVRQNILNDEVALSLDNYTKVLYGNNENDRPDVFSEGILVGHNMVADDENPIYESMYNNGFIAYADDGGIYYGFNAIQQYAVDNYEECGWSAYWWGSDLIMRPLLAVITYAEAIKLWQYVMLGLLAIVLIVIYKSLGRQYTIAFGIASFSISQLVCNNTFVLAMPFLVACIYRHVFKYQHQGQ